MAPVILLGRREATPGRFVARVARKKLTSPDHEANIEYSHLGEYPWHHVLRLADEWIAPEQWNEYPVPVRATVATYRCENAGNDNGPEFAGRMPDRWAYFTGVELDFSRPGDKIITSIGRLRRSAA